RLYSPIRGAPLEPFLGYGLSWIPLTFVVSLPLPAMPPPLTPRQRQILESLHAHLARPGRTPSGPEIARRFGFSQPASAYQHLRQIAAKGYLRLEQTGKNRLLRIALLEPARHLFEPAWPR